MNKKIFRVSIVLMPEASASTLLSIYDTFALFEQIVPGDIAFEISIIAESSEPVSTASRIALQAELTFDDTSAQDIVVVPALLLPASGWRAGVRPRLIEWLRSQHA